MIWLIYTSWNNCHDKFSEHPSSHRDIKFQKRKKSFSLWWKLWGFTILSFCIYNIQHANYINHIVHCIHSTYLAYFWKFVPFDHLHPIPPPTFSPLQLLVTANLTSFSEFVWSVIDLQHYVKFLVQNRVIQYLYTFQNDHHQHNLFY